MQFLSGLFGGNSAVTAVLALVFVLALIVFGLWLLKLTMRTTAGFGRGRNRRLSVVDQMQVDARRQLLIIRRDNVEHLILTGGPQDLVVEANIAVEPAAALHPQPAVQPKPAEAPVVAAPPPPPAPPAMAVASRMDRLRDLARPAAARRFTSLRHTGLFHAAAPEPPMAGDNASRPKADSAKAAPGVEQSAAERFGPVGEAGTGGKAGRP